MSESISAFDGNYVRLGQVAALLAQERAQCAADDVMDLFKRSVFAREFEPPSFEVGETREDPRNWLHMEIEAPRCTLPPDHAALSVRPKQLYGVNRSTIASVLLTTDALPGGRVEWEPLLDITTLPYTGENGFSALGSIPFRDYPERGRRELEALLIPIEKLAPWLEKRGWSLPGALAAAVGKEQGLGEAAELRSGGREVSTSEARRAGRPQKRAWPRVVELVRQLAAEHRDWQKKELAGEAWKRASKEFSADELPSEATIQRHMADILGGGSG
jgi:hypothetical protein